MKNDEKRILKFKAIGDLFKYAIRENDVKLATKVSEFIPQAMRDYRKIADYEVIYPIEFYRLIFDSIRELIITGNRKLEPIVLRIADSSCLLGEPTEDKKVSQSTWIWIWNNLRLIIESEKNDMVLSHWVMAYQYSTGLRHNIKDRKQLIERMDEVFQFHLILGGLVVHSNNYKLLDRLLTFTNSEPPRYELIPIGLNNLFRWFLHFNSYSIDMIIWNYSFPGTEGVKADSVALFAVKKYLIILIARQMTLIPDYHYYGEKEEVLRDPSTQKERKEYLDGLESMKIVLSRMEEDEGPRKILQGDWYHMVQNFITSSKRIIEESFERTFLTQPIAKSKRESYFKYVSDVVKGMAEYDEIFIDREELVGCKEFQLIGISQPSPKAAFADDQSTSYDESFLFNLPYQVLQEFRDEVSRIFIRNSKGRFLLSRSKIREGIEKLLSIVDKQDFVLIGFGFNADQFEKIGSGLEVQKQIRFEYISPSSNPSIFILNRTELPSIKHVDFDEEEIEKFEMELPEDEGAEEKKVYGSLVDLNLNRDVREIVKRGFKENKDIRSFVRVGVHYLTKIYWVQGNGSYQFEIFNDWDEGEPDSLDKVPKLV